MDWDMLVRIGWTGLLAWNLKETVRNGKDIAGIKAKLENGLGDAIDEIKKEIEDLRTLRGLRRRVGLGG
jgi:hypothetical protein